jgi:peptide deformylase
MAGAASPHRPEDENDLSRFSIEFKELRLANSLSREALAKRMDYSRSYVSKVESGAEPPSKLFLKKAEEVFQDGGVLRRAFDELRQSRALDDSVGTNRLDSVNVIASGGLVVEQEHAHLYYDGDTYRLTVRRKLCNQGTEPVDRYHIRISVIRYPDPGDSQRNAQLYADYPLTWDELDLHAWHGSGRKEPMKYTAHHDKPDFKEVWLHFKGATGHFALYPGESCWIEYEYTVSDMHWGNWFKRAIRVPTRRVSMRLDFPARLNVKAWGLHDSTANDPMPFRRPLQEIVKGDRHIFSWSTENPPLQAGYKVAWNFLTPPHENEEASRPSQNMIALGIRQRDDKILHRRARLFDLPDEYEDAERIVAELKAAAERVSLAHVFGKGMGIAAQQIGIDRAAAIVRTLEGKVIILLNPEIISESGPLDEQYEGCLSFFDFRGLVPRSLRIEVAHVDFDGTTRITSFEQGIARLVAHEIDHLYGHLYIDRMNPGVDLIPVEKYRGTGTSWQF